ncbi:MucBP domain-containing protein, partial [Vagococcus hydrophili]
MKNYKIKWLLSYVGLCVVFCLTSIQVFSEEIDNKVDWLGNYQSLVFLSEQGNPYHAWGETAEWSYNEGTQTLTIDGKIEGFSRPWNLLEDEIKHIKIKNQFSIVGSAEGLFSSLPALESIESEKIDTSQVTSMEKMFFKNISLKEVNVENWDTTKVKSMAEMFSSCLSLEEINVTKWNTKNVTDMERMFYSCGNLRGLNVSDWKVLNVENIDYMFSECLNLVYLDVSKWNTSKVITMRGVFNDCFRLKNLNVSDWNVSSVEYVDFMFYNCKTLTELNLSKWNVSKFKTASEMFSGCENLQMLNISNWRVESLSNMESMFKDCRSLLYLDLTGFNMVDVVIEGEKLKDDNFLQDSGVRSLNVGIKTRLDNSGLEILAERSVDDFWYNDTAVNNGYLNTNDFITMYDGLYPGFYTSIDTIKIDFNIRNYDDTEIDKFYVISQKNEKIKEPEILENPEYEQYQFSGWYMDEELKQVWDFNNTTFNNMTLYSKYQQIGEVIVNYLDDLGNEIESSTKKSGEVGTGYLVEPKLIEGYELDESQLPTNTQGLFTEIPIEVTYVYKKVVIPEVKTGEVIVKYIDSLGNEIESSTKKEGQVGTNYTVEPKSIEGYELDENQLPTNAQGMFTEMPIEVTYIYKKVVIPEVKTGEVYVKYVDTLGIEIEASTKKEGQVGTNYTVEPKSIEGYELDETQLPTNTQGLYTEQPIEVTYVYKKVVIPEVKTGEVYVKYVDTLGIEIEASTKKEGQVGTNYTVEPKIIEGYELDENQLPTNAQGMFTEMPIEVTYVYKKVVIPEVKTGEVYVKYVDTLGIEIEASTKKEGKVGTNYTVEPKSIEGYELDESQLPTNTQGLYTEQPIEVTYVYKKVVIPEVKTGEVIVKYIDSLGNEIESSTKKEGQVGTNYTVEPKIIEGYELDENQLPTNTQGSYTEQPIEVIYVYKKVVIPEVKTGEVYVKYVDTLGIEIESSTKKEGKVGTNYSVEPKLIEGYELDESQLPANTQGLFTEMPIEVTYVYKKVVIPEVKTGEVYVKYVDTLGIEIEAST